MEDLTGRFGTYLSPSSMNAGNTTAGNAELTMTAPGSLSVLPVPDRMDVLPQPRFTNDSPIPVSHPGVRDKVTPVGGRDGAGPGWKDAHDIPKGSMWKEMS